MFSVWEEAIDAQARGLAAVYVLVTDVRGHAPQVVGARMLVGASGRIAGTIGGGAVEHEVIAVAQGMLEGARPQKVEFKLKAELGMCCGGSMEVFLEPIPAVPRLILFGAGHVALPTATLARRVGFDVVVVDQRPELNSEARFGSISREVIHPLHFLESAAPLAPRDYVVICTHDHALDKALLEKTVTSEAGYIGMIGSVRKVKSARRMLTLAEVPREVMARVHAPIGVDILAETPDEIAVSIVAELIRHRRAPTSAKQTRGASVTAMRARVAEDVAS